LSCRFIWALTPLLLIHIRYTILWDIYCFSSCIIYRTIVSSNLLGTDPFTAPIVQARRSERLSVQVQKRSRKSRDRAFVHLVLMLSSPLRSTTTSFSLSRRLFSTSLRRPDYHFDTHHFVQRLEREGLNRAQAEGIMTAMADVIDESIQNMTRNMVTKADQEKARVVPR
jgi:hypothetical protein